MNHSQFFSRSALRAVISSLFTYQHSELVLELDSLTIIYDVTLQSDFFCDPNNEQYLLAKGHSVIVGALSTFTQQVSQIARTPPIDRSAHTAL